MTRDRRGQWNDCSLATNSLDEAAVWIEQQRAEWTDRFDLLDERLRARLQRASDDDHDTHTGDDR